MKSLTCDISCQNIQTWEINSSSMNQKCKQSVWENESESCSVFRGLTQTEQPLVCLITTGKSCTHVCVCVSVCVCVCVCVCFMSSSRTRGQHRLRCLVHCLLPCFNTINNDDPDGGLHSNFTTIVSVQRYTLCCLNHLPHTDSLRPLFHLFRSKAPSI